MGVKTRQRTYLTSEDTTVGVPLTRPSVDELPVLTKHDPIIDVETDTTAVLRYLKSITKTGQPPIYDDGREHGEVFPTVKTMIGGLHLLPEVVPTLSEEEKGRLVDHFTGFLADEVQENNTNFFSRAIQLNDGLRRVHQLRLEARELSRERERLLKQREEATQRLRASNDAPEEEQTAAKEAFLSIQSQVEEAEHASRDANFDLLWDPDTRYVFDIEEALSGDYRRHSENLLNSITGYIRGSVSYEEMESASKDWLSNQEHLVAEAKKTHKRPVEDEAPEPDHDFGDFFRR